MPPSPFGGPLVPPASPDIGATRLDALLDAAEAVIVRDGIASLTLDAVAAEAKVSKGGLLHHFPNKDRLVEALVVRTAGNIRAHNAEAYEQVPAGPGRMARGLLAANLRDMHEWCVSCQRGSAATFSALAHNPQLLEPMREAYAELHRRVADDELPEGIGDVVVAAVDGLWLYWVLGLVPVDQAMIVRVRKALEKILDDAKPARGHANASRKRGAAGKPGTSPAKPGAAPAKPASARKAPAAARRR
ncbi:TetR/AcrR family transcriptional regulator [Aquincola sp. S2]|uniref:TetR/AcrR family transcriptional regulator n=1 Tax=Pseudaquabacterium terrae TaxID=2732868 RepID=A0ABX2EFC1_9BURK|nr:TetR/AcrR family transcriptional regulator [Aquabacterium terrae]NRF67309.1 TetR/AcrR family transcriptional regulator [Aquabacterium terrae]